MDGLAMTGNYDPQKDAAESYDAAIAALRAKLLKERCPAAKRIEVIGACTLYLGDCLEIMPTLERVDAVVTDPPYGIGADKNTRANKKHGRAAAPSRDYGAGNWDSSPPSPLAISTIIEKAKYSILWGGNYFNVPPSSGWLVWDKENGSNGYADCELAWTNIPQAVRRIKWRWAEMLQQDMKNKENRVHPTQKPLEVMSFSIDQIPDVGLVFDPYMGSGTTGVACVKKGRSFIGIEIDERYFDMAVKRIRDAYREPDMFVEAPPKAEQVGMDFE